MCNQNDQNEMIMPESIFNANKITLTNFEGFVAVQPKKLPRYALQMNMHFSAGKPTAYGVPGDYLLLEIGIGGGRRTVLRKDVFELWYDILGSVDDPIIEW